MTNQEINIVIAEFCGYKFITFNKGWIISGDGGTQLNIPDYCGDLNEIHEVEKMLKDPIQQSFYTYYLGDFFSSFEKGEYPTFGFVNSTAKERAKAFLRTIGKWKE